VTEIQYQVEINSLTQRTTDNLPLNGIGRVALTFDDPMVLDEYRHNAVTGGMIFIDRLTNVTVGAGMVRDLVPDVAQSPDEPNNGQYSAFELELNALIRRHFPHWDARDLRGKK
jgi:sulfate adenylyltransferase subunit 1